MGRTIRPIRYEVEAQLDELRRYIKSLRKQDRKHFEELYADVKKHISSISYSNPLNPHELMQWSAILELEKKIGKLKKELKAIKS
ncbi:hypothetical protein GF327_08310 [Candidatus Woesearchaeota archaeon]|nr:hypothetical protein [Candidatus Woesearchaeota archaeon]